MAAALWAYDGWEDLNLVGSEVQNPERNFHRALVGGVVLVAVIYMFFNAVCSVSYTHLDVYKRQS